jgi:hypothetical protein
MRSRLPLVLLMAIVLALLVAGWTWDDGVLLAASWVS